MLITTDYITPTELTGYARQALADLEVNQFTLSQFLPSEQVDDIDYRVTNAGLSFIDAASYRAYDAESAIARRPGFARISGELPPVSRKVRLGEYDRLRLRAASNQAPIVDAIYDDTDAMVRSVAARIELARGSALATGTVVLSEDGVTATVNFGRAGAHTGVAPGTAWTTTASSTPIADLIAWFTTYKTNNGGIVPGAILTSQKVLSLMLRSAEVRAFAAANGTTPSIVSPLVLNTILAAYSLPPIVVNDAQVNVIADNGSVTATRIIPENNLLLLPAPGRSVLGGTFWGTTSESLEADYGLSGDEPGIVAGSYSTKDPVALWTKAAGIAMPVLANPNLSFQAVVF